MEEAIIQKPTFKEKAKRFFTYNTGRRKRVWELDFIRGILILVVTFDHVLLFGYYWNLLEFNGAVGEWFRDEIFLGYLDSPFRKGISPFGLWLFSLLAGVSSSLTKNPAKRAIKTCAFTAAFMLGYLILHFIVPDLVNGVIIFNILAIVSIGTLVELGMQKLKLNNWWRFAIATLTICLGVTYYYSHFIGDGISIKNGFLALMVYNSHGYEVSPNNFEPLLPHLGFFILGALLARFIYKDGVTLTSHEEPPKPVRPVVWAGKQSLLFYILGPVVILLPMILISLLVGLFY